MSKCYKVEDAIAFLNLHCPKDMWEYQIADLPTIDIVHCRECKYYEDPNHKIFENCVKWKDSHGIILPIKPNDSCSYGERVDNE